MRVTWTWLILPSMSEPLRAAGARASAACAVTMLLAAIAIASGCGVRQGVSDADVATVRAARVQAWLEDDDVSVAIVDVRSAEAFRSRRLAGAIHQPLPTLPDVARSLRRYDRVVVYGDNWQDPRSRAAAKTLLKHGVGSVRDFRGGLGQWRARGGPVDGTLEEAAERDVSPTTAPAE